jgi:hypothetical protein
MTECGVSGGIALPRAGLGNTDISVRLGITACQATGTKKVRIGARNSAVPTQNNMKDDV